jgi:hypothetical protein
MEMRYHQNVLPDSDYSHSKEHKSSQLRQSYLDGAFPGRPSGDARSLQTAVRRWIGSTGHLGESLVGKNKLNDDVGNVHALFLGDALYAGKRLVVKVNGKAQARPRSEEPAAGRLREIVFPLHSVISHTIAPPSGWPCDSK